MEFGGPRPSFEVSLDGFLSPPFSATTNHSLASANRLSDSSFSSLGSMSSSSVSVSSGDSDPPEIVETKSKTVGRKRGRIPLACAACRKVRAACDKKRPCERCIRVGCVNQCVDQRVVKEPKQQKQKPAADRAKPTPPGSSLTPPPQFSSPTLSVPLPVPTKEISPTYRSKTGAFLPLAPANAMRFYSDSYLQSTLAIHRAATTPQLRKKQLVTAMAYLFNTLSQLSSEYGEYLKEAARANDYFTFEENHHSNTNSTSSQPHGQSLFNNSNTHYHNSEFSSVGPSHALFSNNDGETGHSQDSNALSIIQNRLSESTFLSPSIQLHPSQSVFILLSSHLAPGPSQAFSLDAVDRSDLPMPPLPVLPTPPSSSDSEQKVYAILNVWRGNKYVQAAVRHYFGNRFPRFDLTLKLHAERCAARMVPFGVIVWPVFPRSFSVYPTWSNEQAARMFGYDPDRLHEILNMRRSFFALYQPYSLPSIHVNFLRAIATGRRSVTLPIDFIRKDGSTCRTICTSHLNYADSLLIFVTMYLQELPGSPSPQIALL